MGRRVWPGGMGARDQAGNNAIDAAQMIEQKKLPTTTGPDERHTGARRSKHEAVVRHDQRELVGIVEDLERRNALELVRRGRDERVVDAPHVPHITRSEGAEAFLNIL